MFVWLNADYSQPWRVECFWIPFSSLHSLRWSVLWFFGLFMLRKLLKPQNTSAQSSCRSNVMSAVLASPSAYSFPQMTVLLFGWSWTCFHFFLAFLWSFVKEIFAQSVRWSTRCSRTLNPMVSPSIKLCNVECVDYVYLMKGIVVVYF